MVSLQIDDPSGLQAGFFAKELLKCQIGATLAMHGCGKLQQCFEAIQNLPGVFAKAFCNKPEN